MARKTSGLDETIGTVETVEATAVAPGLKAPARTTSETIAAENDLKQIDQIDWRGRAEKAEAEVARLNLELLKRDEVGTKDCIILHGRHRRIVRGPIAAKWIDDEVKKGFIEEDRMVVVVGD